jgi:hypothetical protein
VRCTINPNVPGNFEGDESIVHQALLTNSMCRGDVHKDIKVIKRDVVLRNCLHFLLMQWMKTDAVLLCSALTCDPKSYSYTLMSNFSNLECAVSQLTAGLRRVYLNKDARFWHRNTAGPWDRVLQTSMHVYILLLHIISVRPSKQPLMVRTFLKVFMELGSYFLFLLEQIKDIIIIVRGQQAVHQA